MRAWELAIASDGMHSVTYILPGRIAVFGRLAQIMAMVK
jgi:hypothetical protein